MLWTFLKIVKMANKSNPKNCWLTGSYYPMQTTINSWSFNLLFGIHHYHVTLTKFLDLLWFFKYNLIVRIIGSDKYVSMQVEWLCMCCAHTAEYYYMYVYAKMH